MELKYGDSKTYKYQLDDDKVKSLTSKTNRSKAQTQFLFNLVDGDFDKLKELETQIKNCFVNYCPGSKDEVVKLLNMKPKSNYFKLD